MTDLARDLIEAHIDRYGIANVIEAIAGICGDKAAHIADNWQDASLAKQWARVGVALARKPYEAALILEDK